MATLLTVPAVASTSTTTSTDQPRRQNCCWCCGASFSSSCRPDLQLLQFGNAPDGQQVSRRAVIKSSGCSFCCYTAKIRKSESDRAISIHITSLRKQSQICAQFPFLPMMLLLLLLLHLSHAAFLSSPSTASATTVFIATPPLQTDNGSGADHHHSWEEYNEWRASVERQRAEEALLGSTSEITVEGGEQQGNAEPPEPNASEFTEASYKGVKTGDVGLGGTEEDGDISPLYEGSLPGSRRGSMEDLFTSLGVYNHDLTTYELLLGDTEDTSAFADPVKVRSKSDIEVMPPPPVPPPQSSAIEPSPSPSTLQERKQKKKKSKKSRDSPLRLLVKAATKLSPDFVLPLLASQVPQGQGVLSETNPEPYSSMMPIPSSTSSGENILPPLSLSQTAPNNFLHIASATDNVTEPYAIPLSSAGRGSSLGNVDNINVVSEMLHQSPSSPLLSIMVPPTQIIPQDIPRRSEMNAEEMEMIPPLELPVDDDFSDSPENLEDLVTKENAMDNGVPTLEVQVLTISNSSEQEETTDPGPGPHNEASSLIQPASYIVTSLESVFNDFEADTWNSTVAHHGERLPPFNSLKKRLPRSVYLETESSPNGEKRYRVDGEDEAWQQHLENGYYYSMSPTPNADFELPYFSQVPPALFESQPLKPPIPRSRSAASVTSSILNQSNSMTQNKGKQNFDSPRPPQAKSAGPILYGAGNSQQRLLQRPRDPASPSPSVDTSWELQNYINLPSTAPMASFQQQLLAEYPANFVPWTLATPGAVGEGVSTRVGFNQPTHPFASSVAKMRSYIDRTMLITSHMTRNGMRPGQAPLNSQMPPAQPPGQQVSFTPGLSGMMPHVSAPIVQIPTFIAPTIPMNSPAAQNSQIPLPMAARRQTVAYRTTPNRSTKRSRKSRQVTLPVASNGQIMPISTATNSQMNSQMPSSSQFTFQMPPSAFPFNQVPSSPGPYSQMPASPVLVNQMPPSSAPHSQMLPSGQHNQMPSSPGPYNQILPSPAQRSRAPPLPVAYNQVPPRKILPTPVVQTRVPFTSVSNNQINFPSVARTPVNIQTFVSDTNNRMQLPTNSQMHQFAPGTSIQTLPTSVAYSQLHSAAALNRQMPPTSATNTQVPFYNPPNTHILPPNLANRPIMPQTNPPPMTSPDSSMLRIPLPGASARRNNPMRVAALPPGSGPSNAELPQQNVEKPSSLQAQRPWPGTLTLEEQLRQPITPIVPRQPLSPYLSKFSIGSQNIPNKDGDVPRQGQQYQQQLQQQLPPSPAPRQQQSSLPGTGRPTSSAADQQNAQSQPPPRQAGSNLLPLAYAQPYPPAPQSAHHNPSQYREHMPFQQRGRSGAVKIPVREITEEAQGLLRRNAVIQNQQPSDLPRIRLSQAQAQQQSPHQAILLQNLLSNGNPNLSKGTAATNPWVQGQGQGRGTAEGGNSQPISPGYERVGTPFRKEASNFQNIGPPQGYEAREQFNYPAGGAAVQQQQSPSAFSYLQQQLEKPITPSNRYPANPAVNSQSGLQQWSHPGGGNQEGGVSSSQILPRQPQGQRSLAPLDRTQAGTPAIQAPPTQRRYPTGQFGGAFYPTPSDQNPPSSKPSWIDYYRFNRTEGQQGRRKDSGEQQSRSNVAREPATPIRRQEIFRNNLPIGSTVPENNPSGSSSGGGSRAIKDLYSAYNSDKLSSIETTTAPGPTTSTTTPHSPTTAQTPEVVAGGERVLFRSKPSGSQPEADGFGGSGYGRGAQDTRGIGEGRSRGEFSIPIIDNSHAKSQLPKQYTQQLQEIASSQSTQHQTPSNNGGHQRHGQIQGGDEGGETGGRVGNVPAVAGGYSSFGFGKGQPGYLRKTGGGGNDINVRYGNSTAWGSTGNHNDNGGEGGRGSGSATQRPPASSIPHQSQEHESQRSNTPAGGGENHPHFRKRLPHHGGDMPFYSQSELDAHHQRVSHNAQTSKDTEFENDSTILSWYLQRAKQELRHRQQASPHKKHGTDASTSHQRIGQGSGNEQRAVRSLAVQQSYPSSAEFPLADSYSTGFTGNSPATAQHSATSAPITAPVAYGGRVPSISNPSEVVPTFANAQEIYGSAPSSRVQFNAYQDGLSSFPRSPAPSSSSPATGAPSSPITFSGNGPHTGGFGVKRDTNPEQQQQQPSGSPRVQSKVTDFPYPWHTE